MFKLLEVVAQNLGTRGVTKFRHRLRLDLANTFAGNAVHLADLVQSAWHAVGKPEPELHHASLALGERLEHILQLILQKCEGHGIDGNNGLGVPMKSPSWLSPSSPMV